MASKKSQIALSRVNNSYLNHLLDDSLYKEQVNCQYYNKEILAHEKQKNDAKWRKQHDKLLDDWRNLD